MNRKERQSPSNAPIRLSFLAPAYNEASNIGVFVAAVSDAVAGCPFEIEPEIVFVDDGSHDETFGAMIEARDTGRIPITAIQFSRNFGKEAAILAALKHASGDLLCIIDTDMQQPPRVALQMAIYLLEHPECDCVAAFQQERISTPWRNAFSRAFYGMLSWFSDMNIVQDASDFRVFRRSVASALLELPEYYRFSKGLFAWVGFNVQSFPYVPEQRRFGSTTWSFAKLVRYAIDGLLSFTTKPLLISLFFGFALSFAAVAYLVVVLVQALVFSIDVPGYATLVCLLLIIGGGLFFVQGITGEYIARIYIQGKHRPSYIIRDIARKSEEE